MTPPRCLIAALVCALALAPEATAGGWWSFAHVDRQTVAVGERVHVQSEAWFTSVAEAREAEEDGRFYVYLLRRLDGSMVNRAMSRPFRRNWWSPGDAEAVRVARVRLALGGSNLGRAYASFTTPELELGAYAVMLCDAGCEHPLATVVPTRGFTVVADPATARLDRRLDRLQERMAIRGHRLAAAPATARQAQFEAEAVESVLERLQTRVGALERRIREQPDPESFDFWRFAGWLTAAALALTLAALAVSRRRRPERSPLAWSAEDEVLLASGHLRPRRTRTPAR